MGGNSRRTRSRGGPRRWDWIAVASWWNFNGRGISASGWAKKEISWDGIYCWWRCCESYWNDHKGFRLLHKQLIKQGWEGIDCNFERNSALCKMFSNSFACYREIVSHKVSWCSKLCCFKKLPKPPQHSGTTTLISQQPLTFEARSSTSKKIITCWGSDDG